MPIIFRGLPCWVVRCFALSSGRFASSSQSPAQNPQYYPNRRLRFFSSFSSSSSSPSASFIPPCRLLYPSQPPSVSHFDVLPVPFVLSRSAFPSLPFGSLAFNNPYPPCVRATLVETGSPPGNRHLGLSETGGCDSTVLLCCSCFSRLPRRFFPFSD